MAPTDVKHSMITALIAIYPYRWRNRYADEFAMVLEESPLTASVVADVCCGAVDAHLNYGREAQRVAAHRGRRQRRAAMVAWFLLVGSPVALHGARLTTPRSLLP